MTENGLPSEIDSCECLYLRSLSEPQDNSLRLILQEAGASPMEMTVRIGDVDFKGLRPIESTASSRTFEVLWRRYVAYAVLNESFTGGDTQHEVFSGRLLRIYKQSQFLDYVQSATFAGPEYPGPLTHIRVLCLNHIVDVIAVDLPSITTT
jgi:hypothetical protein